MASTLSTIQMDPVSAKRFVSSLSKSLQALCHGCMDFDTQIEIVGFINLNIDCLGKVDYVLNEKVSKCLDSSMSFISNSYLAKKDESKPSQERSCSPIPELDLDVQRQTFDNYNNESINKAHHGYRSSAIFSPHSKVVRGSKRQSRGSMSFSHSQQTPTKSRRTENFNSSFGNNPYHQQTESFTYNNSRQSHQNQQNTSSSFSSQPSTSQHHDNSNININSPASTPTPLILETHNIKTEISDHPPNQKNDYDHQNVSSGLDNSNLTTVPATNVLSDVNKIKPDPDDFFSTNNIQPPFNSDNVNTTLQSFNNNDCSASTSGQSNQIVKTEGNDASTSSQNPGDSDIEIDIAMQQQDETEGEEKKFAHFHYSGSVEQGENVGASSLNYDGEEESGDVIEIDEEEDESEYNADHNQYSDGYQVAHNQDFEFDNISGKYACSLCGKLYVDTASAYRHVKLKHKGEFSHYCTFCGKGFAERRYLAGHVMTVHGMGEKYSCSKCQKTYAHLSSLRKHKKMVHGD